MRFSLKIIFCMLLGIVFFRSELALTKKMDHKWSVKTQNGVPVATNPDWPKLKIPLKISGAGDPHPVEWKKIKSSEDDLYMLTYESGVVGTSERTMILRGILVRAKTSEVVADEILNYVDPHNPNKKLGSQPEWTWTPNMVMVQIPSDEKPRQVNLRGKRADSELKEESK